MRGNRRGPGLVFGAALLITTAAGCGLSGSGDDSGRLQTAIDELASVGGPDDQEPQRVEVSNCDDPVEMPMSAATFEYDGFDDERDVEAANAEGEELTEWYLPRWEELGWEADEYGSVSKEFDGKRLRASVDGVTGTTYTVIVSREGAGLCS